MRTKLKEAREVAGFTQEDLAKSVDVTRQTILFLEKGKYNPSLRLAWRISQVIGKPIEELFSFNDENWKPRERIRSTLNTEEDEEVYEDEEFDEYL